MKIDRGFCCLSLSRVLLKSANMSSMKGPFSLKEGVYVPINRRFTVSDVSSPTSHQYKRICYPVFATFYEATIALLFIVWMYSRGAHTLEKSGFHIFIHKPQVTKVTTVLAEFFGKISACQALSPQVAGMLSIKGSLCIVACCLCCSVHHVGC